MPEKEDNVKCASFQPSHSFIAFPVFAILSPRDLSLIVGWFGNEGWKCSAMDILFLL